MAEKRAYEVMFIAAPETADEDVAKLNDSITTLIETEGGSVVKLEDMGRRKLAYPINKKTEGYYVLFEIEGSGQEISELERRMRVNDMIIRYLTVRVDQERKTAQKLTDKRESRQKRNSERNNASSNRNKTEENMAEEAQEFQEEQ
ncbi:MAG: 30S ribosomal protein S6 [Acidobacteriota bacterium]|nr:30S ribosomal protein S6 [Acidobacteriota bacterium]